MRECRFPRRRGGASGRSAFWAVAIPPDAETASSGFLRGFTIAPVLYRFPTRARRFGSRRTCIPTGIDPSTSRSSARGVVAEFRACSSCRVLRVHAITHRNAGLGAFRASLVGCAEILPARDAPGFAAIRAIRFPEIEIGRCAVFPRVGLATDPSVFLPLDDHANRRVAHTNFPSEMSRHRKGDGTPLLCRGCPAPHLPICQMSRLSRFNVIFVPVFVPLFVICANSI